MITKPDLEFTRHVNIYAIHPKTSAAKDWLPKNLPAEASTWGGIIVLEDCHVADFKADAINAGLIVA